MSYCRWSTDDFQCDLYCYEGNDDRYWTHVAGNRVHWKIELPPPEIENLLFKNGRMNKTALNRHIKRTIHVGNLLNEENEGINYERLPIGLAYDGQTFTDDTPEEFKDTLLLLKMTGYRFPDFEP